MMDEPLTHEPLTLHRQVHIALGELSAEVDERLAPLILELWRAGIKTALSCQQHLTSKAWIAFTTADDAKRFLDIICSGDVRHRAWARRESWYFGAWDKTATSLPEPHTGHPAGWEFHVSPFDDDRTGDRPSFRLVINVLLPRRDVKIVLQRLREFNAEAAALNESPAV